ncbi:MAG: acyl carrier protein [Pseudomonadota bacterium]|nr:acyl carrier protein [Pseudomonadota bacterium]
MIASQIKHFVLQNFLFTDDQSVLRNDQSLLQSGTLDSTGILELITFVEDTFHIRVADEEMLPANFDSIDAIAAFVAGKKQAA